MVDISNLENLGHLRSKWPCARQSYPLHSGVSAYGGSPTPEDLSQPTLWQVVCYHGVVFWLCQDRWRLFGTINKAQLDFADGYATAQKGEGKQVKQFARPKGARDVVE